jgi:hypothetical protein
VTSRATDVRGGVAAHRQAEDDWLEAEAIVEEHRRRADAAAARASDRLRAADALRRSGRRDPWALGTIDAAHLHLARAREEADRLRDVEARCAALRARADAARAEVDRLLAGARNEHGIAVGPAAVVAPPRRLRCG